MRISDWSSDVCSSDLAEAAAAADGHQFSQCLTVDAELFTGDERVVSDRDVRRHQRVVDQFRALAGTDAAEVDDAAGDGLEHRPRGFDRSAEHTSDLQSLMRLSYAVFFLIKKTAHTS